MEHLKQYPDEFIKPLLLSFDIMSRFNVHIFNESESFLKANWRFSYMIPCLVLFYISFIAYIPRMFTHGTTASELAFSVSVFFIIIQAFLKAAIVIPKKQNISTLIKGLGDSWMMGTLNLCQIKKKEACLKTLNIGLTVFFWGSMIPSWQIMLAPAFLTLRRLVFGLESPYYLPFGCILPFDPVQNWLRYIETYIFQVYSMLLIIYVYIGTEILMLTLVALLNIEFAMLREEFRNVKPSTKRDLQVSMKHEISIEDLICRHQTLLKLGNELDHIFNKMLYVDLLFVTIIMCFFGFGTTVARGVLDLVNNIIAVLALLLPTFIFCYYGEQLKQESAGIAESAYNNEWYNGNAKYQKIIRFVIMRAHRPSCLTSLKQAPITLHTFSKVISTTWSYFSLLTSVYSKN